MAVAAPAALRTVPGSAPSLGAGADSLSDACPRGRFAKRDRRQTFLGTLKCDAFRHGIPLCGSSRMRGVLPGALRSERQVPLATVAGNGSLDDSGWRGVYPRSFAGVAKPISGGH